MGKKASSGAEWAAIVETQIQEAMQKGAFCNLPGEGRPLNLMRNPHLGDDMEMAYKILQDHGFAPEWIEADKEVRASIQRWRARVSAAREAHRRALEAAEGRPSPWSGMRRREAADEWDRQWAILRRELAGINRAIDVLNLKIPMAWLHRPRLDPEQELDRAGLGETCEPEE